MRATSLTRLLILILLLTATVAAPTVPTLVPAAIAGDDGNGNGKDKDKDDRSKDKGDKDVDEDDGNRGNSNDDKEDKDDRKAVTADAGYTVDVTCEPNADTTACTFVPVTPEGQKKVSHLLVPEAILCTDVVQADARYVDPEPKMQETGYLSHGEGKDVVLQLAGTVEAAGTATYWLKAAGTIHPAVGSALACDAAAAKDDSTPAAPTTGTVVIEAYGCGAVDPGAGEIDWFGACQLDASAHEYQLAQVTDKTTPLHTTMSSEHSLATFSALAPGVYTLEDAGDSWCHAESDGVNTDGNLIVKAGGTTTVWLFYCAA